MGTYTECITIRTPNMILQLLTLCLFFVKNCSGSPAYLSKNGTKQDPGTGIVISGGRQALNKWVELFIPSTGDSCLFPSVPDIRKGHSMNNMYICGGDDFYARDLCIQFVDGHWTSLSSTRESRDDHSSWLTPQGLVLMGGDYNGGKTTEIITLKGGQGGPGFTLNYETRGSCTIVDDDTNSIIVTGGMGDEVTRYDLLGYVEDLPSMLRIRNDHGCGSFINSEGTPVLLAAGGFDHVEFEYMSSTELLTIGSGAWTETTPLPTVIFGMRTANVDNKVLMLGGNLRDMGTDTENIWEWDAAESQWKKIGEMKTGRSNHAVSSIQLDEDLLRYCV